MSSVGRVPAAGTALVLLVLAGCSVPPSPGSDADPDVGQTSAAQACLDGEAGPHRIDTELDAGSGAKVPYSVSLPDGYYDDCDRDYPVIYALHGKGQDNVGFLDEALALRRPMSAGVLEEAVIVTPDSFGDGRWEDDGARTAETNVVEHLLPHVEETYRVRTGPSARLLVGFSMGGHGALRFGLKYPDQFAAVWSVDGAMSPDAEDYLRYIDSGTADEGQHIVAVGGQLNGDRVQATLDALSAAGVDVQHAYQDRPHEFAAFVDGDEEADWYAARFLQQHLG